MWLRRAHPNFFISLVATLLFNVGQGLVGFAPPSWVNAPSLHYVNQLASYQAWAVVFGVVALGVLLGLMRQSWWVATRLTLALGVCVCVVRGALIAYSTFFDGKSGITGVPAWILIAAIHFAQLGEPTSNPLAQGA